MNLTKSSLLLSALRALLFNVISEIRLIQIKVEKDLLRVYVYCDRELSDDEKDIYYSFAGEVSGDFIELKSSNVDFIVSKEKFKIIPDNGELIYARYGE